jgi:hypothetical protein
MIWAKKNNKIIHKGVKEKTSKISSNISNSLLNTSVPQKLIIDERSKNGR